MKQLVSEISKEYPSIDTNNLKMVFQDPFTSFVHRWHELLELGERTTAWPDGPLTVLLRETLSELLSEPLSALGQFKKTGYIDFSNLGLVLVPGHVIIRRTDDVKTARKTVTNEREHYVLEVEVIDWNGNMCGYRVDSWYIESFEKAQQLKSLQIFPLEILTNEEQERMKTSLIERGKFFESLCGQHLRHYVGQVHAIRGSSLFTTSVSMFVISNGPLSNLSADILADRGAHHG